MLYTIGGKWTDQIMIQKNTKNAPQEIFFDVAASSICPKVVEPEERQEEYESRKLWTQLTAAMLARNMDLATDEKTKVEDQQRKLRSDREGNHEEHKSRFFSCENDEWRFSKDK